MAQVDKPSFTEQTEAMESLSLQKTVPDEPPPSYSDSVEQPQVATRTASNDGLQKPIAIPATTAKVGSPFLRAYPPTIEAFSLPKEVFLRFLDDLNRVAVASPPLKVLGMASNIVGFVPLHEAQIASAAAGAAASIGTYVVSKSRTELYLRKANREIFKPRGLKVEIGKVEALAKIASMPFLDDDGKLDKETALLNPVQSWELTPTITGQERRLRAFEPWIAQLDLEPLPNIDVPKNPLSKWEASASERQRKKGEKRMMKSRQKAYKKGPEGVEDKYQKRMAKLDEQAEEAGNTASTKQARKIEKRRAKAERKHDKRLAKADQAHTKNKEEKGTRKILWLIIRNLDADSGEGPDPYTDGISESSDTSYTSDSSSSSSSSSKSSSS